MKRTIPARWAFTLTLLALAVAITAPVAAELPDLIPIEARLSPDGMWLSYLAPSEEEVLNVWVEPLGGQEGEPRQVTQDTNRGIRNHFWSEDGKRVLYLQDIGGASVDSKLSVMLDLGRLQDVPAQEQILITQVLDRESFETHDLEVLVSRMRHPRTAATLASITVRLLAAFADSHAGPPPAQPIEMADLQDPSMILRFTEAKTVWHPIGA